MLGVVEGRVLGCLLEKERTTPDQYPLTMNALVLACNQATNREPVMALEPHEVDAAVASLKAAGLARIVHPSHGRSVSRFRQVADEHFGWSTEQASVMSVLLVRGPQTVAELKARTERLHLFDSPAEVEVVLHALSGDAGSATPFAVQLERQPGQKELRWQQLLAEEADPVARTLLPAPAGTAMTSIAMTSTAMTGRIEQLEARVARLEAALGDLLS